MRKLIPSGKGARLLLLGAVAVGGLSGYHRVSTFANRTNAARFEIATVSLALTQTGDEGYTALDIDNVRLGADMYTGLDVQNSGSSAFRYSMTSTPSGDGGLDSSLRVAIAAVRDGSCDAATFGDGLMLEPEEAGIGNAFITSRPLGAGATEHLCFHVRLPMAPPNQVLGADAQATLDFTAQQ